MKFALIGPVYPYRGGIAHYTTSLANAFKDAGHEVKVFSFSRQYPRWLYPGKSDKDPSKVYQQVEALYTIDTLNPFSWIRTARLISQYRPDLVIFQWWTTFMAPAFSAIGYMCRTYGLNPVFLIHNVYPHEAHFLDRFLSYIGLLNGKAYIVQSEGEKEKLKKLFPSSEVHLHPHPIYQADLSKIIEKKEAKLRLGLNPELPVALFLGIVRPYKGLRLLIRAISDLKKKGKHVQLLVAGEFWENIQIFIERINELEISDLVYLKNYYIPQEEIPLYFSAADVFVAPYIEGTQSGASKLAISYNIPIILSDVLQDEILREYTTANFFDHKDNAALSKALEETLEKNDFPDRNIKLRNKMSWSSLTRMVIDLSLTIKESDC